MAYHIRFWGAVFLVCMIAGWMGGKLTEVPLPVYVEKQNHEIVPSGGINIPNPAPQG